MANEYTFEPPGQGTSFLTQRPSMVENVTTATLTLSRARHAAPRMVTLNRAAGQAVTLPAASGSGDTYVLMVGTTITSNSTTVKVANTSDAFQGLSMVVSDDAGGPAKGYIAALGSDDTVTLNGTTTGGYAGDMLEFRDVALNRWQVNVRAKATGTEATPFSATV